MPALVSGEEETNNGDIMSLFKSLWPHKRQSQETLSVRTKLSWEKLLQFGDLGHHEALGEWLATLSLQE